MFITSLGNWIALQSTPRSEAVRTLEYGLLIQPLTVHIVSEQITSLSTWNRRDAQENSGGDSRFFFSTSLADCMRLALSANSGLSIYVRNGGPHCYNSYNAHARMNELKRTCDKEIIQSGTLKDFSIPRYLFFVKGNRAVIFFVDI